MGFQLVFLTGFSAAQPDFQRRGFRELREVELRLELEVPPDSRLLCEFRAPERQDTVPDGGNGLLFSLTGDFRLAPGFCREDGKFPFRRRHSGEKRCRGDKCRHAE